MHVATYIVLALAFGINTMILMRRCAEATPIKLTKGLGITFLVSIVSCLFFMLGISLGDLLRIEGSDAPQLYARTNAFISLGLAVFVSLRMLLPYLRRKPQLAVFDLRNWGSVAAMAVASSINILLTGLGLGFVNSLSGNIHWAIWPMFVSVLILGYLGIMFGRQKVEMRPRRWMIVACILIIGSAIAAVVNA
ncbi:MAG: manganese efflux pump [Bacteroidaceae bacterium]|nr:manganese efflux pump [Bacteroidaceae bacterium]